MWQSACAAQDKTFHGIRITSIYIVGGWRVRTWARRGPDPIGKAQKKNRTLENEFYKQCVQRT